LRRPPLKERDYRGDGGGCKDYGLFGANAQMWDAEEHVTKLWTIGYEKVGQADFLAALKAAQIKTLVDVREVANSRRAGFSKKSLAAALDEPASLTFT
jgi:hypothetical protein